MNNQSLSSLTKGDVVELRSELHEWIVANVYNCSEVHQGRVETYRWVEYQLEARSGTDQAWLVVEVDDGETLAWFFNVELEAEAIGYERGQEFPETIKYEGQTFKLDEDGQMTVGKMGSSISWYGEFADYVNGGDIISIEAFPDHSRTPRETDLEVWYGREIEPRTIIIYPADNPSPRVDVLTGQMQAKQPTTIDHVRAQAPVQAAERRVSTMTDSAQRNLKIAGGATGIIIMIIILMILL